MEQESDTIILDDDSVPSDFFDDFSNQDFMAGLDVVDAWDDEEESITLVNVENGTDVINEKKNENSKKSRRTRRNRRSKRSRSRSGGVRKRGKTNLEDNTKRDPEKAKRDIQRDKDKWTKDNEAKLVSERLRVVETGLVPPGTEMDVDIRELKSTIAVVDLREKLRKKSRSRSFDLSTSLTHRKRSRERKRSLGRRRSRSRSKNKSPIRSRNKSTSRSRNRSPNRRSRTRRQSVSPHRRSVSPRRFSVERRSDLERPERFRDVSPAAGARQRHRRYSRSPARSPNLSDREVWMRGRKYPRRRSVSPSKVMERRRNAPKDFLEELADKLKYDEKKKKILQEISHKLNEPSQPNMHDRAFPPVSGPMGLHPRPGPPPPMGPHPNFFQPPPIKDPAPQYDQTFFIGQSDGFRSNSTAFPPPFVPKMVPQPVKAPMVHNLNKTLGSVPPPLVSFEQQMRQEKKAATKLLEDKSISLSDFLTVTAKYNDSSKPINIHKKVKVLAQCQDAMKALGSTSKLSGRFFYKKSEKEPENPPTVKCLSPLRKIPVTRFGFTTPWKGGDDKQGLPPLHKLMASLRLTFVPPVDEPLRSSTPASTESDIVYVPVAPAPPQHQVVPSFSAVVRFQNKQIQTDVTKCENCEKRKAIRYRVQGSQCCPTTDSIGTQITDADMQRLGVRLVGVETKKSLAQLTPAQLLGKDGPSHRLELFPAARATTPPAPNITPEKQRLDLPMRRGNQAQSVSKLPSLIDQLKSSMKPYEQPTGARQNFYDPNELSSRQDRINRDLRSSFNRMPEYEEQSPPFMQQRGMFEENIRMQPHLLSEDLRMQQLLAEEQMRQQQQFFEPPARRDGFFPQGYGSRNFF